MDPFRESIQLRYPRKAELYEQARRAMGQTRVYAERMGLAAMTPQNKLTSTGYCLEAPGSEHLVYQPEIGSFTVDLAGCAGPVQVEWFNPQTGDASPGDPISGGAETTLCPPFKGTAVVHLVTST